MDALAFLAKKTGAIGPLYVVHGDEPFLKRHAIRALRSRALGEDADDQAVSTYAGDKASYAEVFDDLQTLPFFHPRRMVVVENADAFVTKHRAALEKKVAELPAGGVLVLDVKTWAANTRLAKMVSDPATLVCKAPPPFRAPAWCSEWAASEYQKQLSGPAATLLVDLVGPELGLLDQELAKLAVYVGNKAKIEPADVDRLVGQSRSENTWKIFDAIATGNPQEVLPFLGRLLDQGEDPMRLVGAFSLQLRRLAQAYRLTQQGLSLGAALERAGVPPFALKSAEAQMRHLSRRRLDRLYDWLLELNMDLRTTGSLSERTLLERFVLRLTRKMEKAPTAR